MSSPDEADGAAAPTVEEGAAGEAAAVPEEAAPAEEEAAAPAVAEEPRPMMCRSVVVLSKAIEAGLALNATAHLSAGLSALMARSGRLDEMAFNDYGDKQGVAYPSISDHPFIVLKGKPGQVKSFRAELQAQGMLHTVFLVLPPLCLLLYCVALV